MHRTPMPDAIVLLPGIAGSVLQKDGRDIWALSGGAAVRALLSLGRNVIRDLALHGDDPCVDNLGDGITAPRVIPDTHLIPGLWTVDGYGKVTATIKEHFDVTSGSNLFEFPYDWRRDIRASSRQLASHSYRWLKAWRERSGNAAAKLILIGHSMGGLVARHYLELYDGWKDTRLLVTFGTPYRGSLNALDFVANGMKREIGPATLIDLSSLVRSFTSVYQLLPIYPCVDPGDGMLRRVTEVPGIPELDPSRAVQARELHVSIREAVKHHQQDVKYMDTGYKIKPLVGSFQPTSQSARFGDDGLKILRSYRGEDQGGDGTVPSISATPLELSNQYVESWVRERHASLQNAAFALDQLTGVIRTLRIDQAQAYAPGTGISLDLADACLSGQPVTVRALPEAEWAALTATVIDIASGAEVTPTRPLRPSVDGWQEAELGPFVEGTYRLTVRGGNGITPVTDVFAVFDEGSGAH